LQKYILRRTVHELWPTVYLWALHKSDIPRFMTQLTVSPSFNYFTITIQFWSCWPVSRR